MFLTLHSLQYTEFISTRCQRPSCGQGRVYTCKRSVNRRRDSFVASSTEIKAIYK